MGISMGRMMIKTASNNPTIFLEGDKQVYPCRCGETHKGDYGFYDWYHHECYHDALVMLFNGVAYCVECGKSITIIDRRENNGKDS